MVEGRESDQEAMTEMEKSLALESNQKAGSSLCGLSLSY
jgi:hypothetical protein